jgi:hypothetical protein
MQPIDGYLQGNRRLVSGSGLPKGGTQEPESGSLETECQNRYCGGAIPLVARIDFRLSAMMGDVYIHGKQHFATGHATVRRVVRLSDLIIGKVGDHV